MFPRLIVDTPQQKAEPRDRLALVRGGDATALHELLVELLPQVRRYLHRLLGERAWTEDAVQDALVELAKALPKFRGGAQLSTYVFRICTRVGYRSLRAHSRRETSLGLIPEDTQIADLRSHVARREVLRRLYRCLDELKPDRRIAFVLCAIEGYDSHEAAAIVGIRPANMRARLKRARRDLARLIDADVLLSKMEVGP